MLASRPARRTGALALLALAAALPGAARAAPLRYVALGDSTAVGVGAERGGGYPHRLVRRLEAGGVPVRLELLAASGATVEDVRAEQLPRLLAAPARPALVTLCIGLNDVMKGRALRDFARDLEVVADFVRRTGAAVVVSTLPDVSRSPSAAGAPASLARTLEAYNATLRRIAERHGFAVADFHAATRRPPDAARALFAADGFHPSEEGYELWAATLAPAAERALAHRAEPGRAAAAAR